MDIKIGFKESPRELVVRSDRTRDDVVAELTAALRDGADVFVLEDAKGSQFLVRPQEVVYVEVGVDTSRTVGFAGA